MNSFRSSVLIGCLPRRGWADYFEKEGIQYAFFSAANAKALQEAKRLAEEAAELEKTHDAEPAPDSSGEEAETEDEDDNGNEAEANEDPHSADDSLEEPAPQSHADTSAEVDAHHLPVDTGEADDPRTRVLSVLELEALFQSSAPDLSSS